jgi:hypothetical protein
MQRSRSRQRAADKNRYKQRLCQSLSLWYERQVHRPRDFAAARPASKIMISVPQGAPRISVFLLSPEKSTLTTVNGRAPEFAIRP